MQQEWGLPCTVTPRFTARLVQERHNLHYLADRAAITGKFSSPDLLHIDQSDPGVYVFLNHLFIVEWCVIKIQPVVLLQQAGQ